MVDYNANLLSTPTIQSVSIDPRGVIPVTVLRVAQPPPPTTSLYFLMRGYRSGTADFETWTAVGAPNTTNPSGQPIVDVTVVAKWTA